VTHSRILRRLTIHKRWLQALTLLALIMTGNVMTLTAAEPTDIRIGLIGLDNSHAVAFAQSLNATPRKPGLEGVRVVAAFPGGSPDLPVSINRVPGFTESVAKTGATIVDSLDDLLKQVDAVIINSVDGRVHLSQAQAVLAAKKPLFIDKPLAVSVKEGEDIFRFARENQTPCFSSSSLRYCMNLDELTKDNPVMGCDVYGPCSVLAHHPDLFFYGIHGVESLFTIMGPGCVSVSCHRTDGTDVVVGTWSDGRIGTFRGIRNGKTGFGGTLFGKNRIVASEFKVNYDLLLKEIVTFFKTGTAPVPPEATLEILTFMEAANASHAQGGIPVPLHTSAPEPK